MCVCCNRCVCRDGYDGDGHSCSPINPCLKSNRGDCDTNVSLTAHLCVNGDNYTQSQVCLEVAVGALTSLCMFVFRKAGQSHSKLSTCFYNTPLPLSSPSLQAQCVYAGPGNASCVCSEGWTGDGRVCVEINNCQLQSRGGCSPNADCNHRGPGQVSS